jgi:hypothetical protein
MFAVSNGGFRKPVEAAIMKATGTVPGGMVGETPRMLDGLGIAGRVFTARSAVDLIAQSKAWRLGACGAVPLSQLCRQVDDLLLEVSIVDCCLRV